MRLVTWNCCRGPFARKVLALDALEPDVAVVQEATSPAEESAHLLWFPAAGSRLGIQVRSRGDYRLSRLPVADLPNCVVPIRVTGPTTFNLLAVWTWPAPSYVRALLNGLSAYSGLLQSRSVVVAGDFNGSPHFDKPGSRFKWASGFDALNEAGLVSAYHHFHDVAVGAEAEGTHHFRRDASRPFHIDFCFVPRQWAVGGFTARVVHGSEWRSLSDHFPVLVDTPA
jgi:endonuclease/exonuclease/phosphatase family metal-dependent hydrolase